jgi:ribosomal protein L13E
LRKKKEKTIEILNDNKCDLTLKKINKKNKKLHTVNPEIERPPEIVRPFLGSKFIRRKMKIHLVFGFTEIG